ncbi:PKD domain-containing protein [Leucothrix arctica]|uniref:PKD/Chitinase domain-containing protein n=1 Tax=Leucothrix arctica TaxID=1481894 RepID=A0A317CGU2_9GAMM|nr:PKD domain-containing protein [Leucothrix arctica]PWQ97579.1 hypothetical protein DKT75_06580 [Leucothrix arctica]
MKLTHLPVLALTLAITACGGSEKGETPQTTAVDSYVGFSYAANLTSNNSFEFLEQVFIGSSSSVLAKASDSYAPEDQISILEMQSVFNTIAFKMAPNDFQARGINETERCANGGTLKLTGTVDDESYTGKLNAEMVNCDQGSGKLNGDLTMDVTLVSEAQQPQAYILGFNNITLTDGTQTYYLAGTQSFDSDRGVDTTISNILQTTSDGRQLLSENFVVVDNTLESFYTGTTETGIDISGKIYIGDYGYVEIFTTDLFQDLPTEIMPYTGTMELFGNDSSLKVMSDFSYTSVLLDGDGNGLHEQIAELNNDASNFEEGLNFTPRQPPLVNISDIGDELTVYVGYDMTFDGFLSTDPSGGQLTYHWQISSKPAGSTSQIQHDSSSPYFITVIPDLAGDYTVTLTVTNESGLSSIESKTVTVLSHF